MAVFLLPIAAVENDAVASPSPQSLAPPFILSSAFRVPSSAF